MSAVDLLFTRTNRCILCRSPTLKTIEGDLFTALVAAGAISKANGADPKKSSFVRCARTDKGVHAAGNVVSLKMIVEDPDIVQKINEKLSPQIRVWGIEVTSKAFSCYQLCDSRVYEYLIPSHCFLPPHPGTFLGKKLPEIAEKCGDLDAYKARQDELAGFWDDVDEKYVRPVLESVPEDVRKVVLKALYLDEEESLTEQQETDEPESKQQNEGQGESSDGAERKGAGSDNIDRKARKSSILEAIKAVKASYQRARNAYRIDSTRLARIQEALDKFVGTNNLFNYTTQKKYSDLSAKRNIKSFKVDPTPVLINGREWLSLKVHGQSFMMHQIRKMVCMAALVVRCGCDPQRIVDTYGPTKIAIPKVPGLGLLLERPLFDSYNKKAESLGKEKILFDKYAKEMNEFKQREIYDRIFRAEEETSW